MPREVLLRDGMNRMDHEILCFRVKLHHPAPCCDKDFSTSIIVREKDSGGYGKGRPHELDVLEKYG